MLLATYTGNEYIRPSSASGSLAAILQSKMIVCTFEQHEKEWHPLGINPCSQELSLPIGSFISNEKIIALLEAIDPALGMAIHPGVASLCPTGLMFAAILAAKVISYAARTFSACKPFGPFITSN